MFEHLPTPRDIELWVPGNLNEVVGCEDLKAFFRGQLRIDAAGVNTLIGGESGSGKTATVKAFVRSLLCPHLDRSTLLPCGICKTCRTFDVRHSEAGIFSVLNERVTDRGADPIHYFPVNCGAATDAQLRDLIDLRPQLSGRFVVYLDEAHRLVRRKMEHLLLKPLEELDCLWIASTANPNELDRMFRRRFSAKLRTTPPAAAELVDFLASRCTVWSICVDDRSTLELVVRRSGLVPALAKSIIAIAAGEPGRLLTRNLIMRHLHDIE